jgi:hypothetical protein
MTFKAAITGLHSEGKAVIWAMQNAKKHLIDA